MKLLKNLYKILSLLLPTHSSKKLHSYKYSTIVLDTSILIKDTYVLNKMENYDTVVIPFIVCEELKHLSENDNPFLKNNAIIALEEIEYHANYTLMYNKMKSGSKLIIFDKIIEHKIQNLFFISFDNTIDKNDNIILATALIFENRTIGNIILASSDWKLRISAKVIGIDVVEKI